MYSIDIVECDINNGGCDPNAQCTNTNGSFTCACVTGFTGDGVSCMGKMLGCFMYFQNNVSSSDVEECAVDNGGCVNAACTNTVGSFTCDCHTGYSRVDEITCQGNKAWVVSL